MTSVPGKDRTRQPEHVVAALHHDGLARLLAVGSWPAMSSSQARELEYIVASGSAGAPSSSSSSAPASLDNRHVRGRRRALWGGPLEDSCAVPDSSKHSIRKKGSQGSAQTAVSASATRASGLQMGRDFVLDDVLPEWYALHNRHCSACKVPLVPGVNCSAVSALGSTALACAACGHIGASSEPSTSGKRSLRSLTVRRSMRDTSTRGCHTMTTASGEDGARNLKRCRGNDAPMPTPASSSPSSQSRLPPGVDISGEPALTAAKVYADSRAPPPMPRTLDEKMKKKAKRVTGDSADQAPHRKPFEGSQTVQQAVRPDASGAQASSPAPSPPPASAAPAPDLFGRGRERGSVIGSLNNKAPATLDQKQKHTHMHTRTQKEGKPGAKPTDGSSDKAALRRLLSANRQKKMGSTGASGGTSSGASASAGPAAPTGLQTFLGSL